MAFQYFPGGGGTDSGRDHRLISHGFDASGCSYETDGGDCIDSGLPEEMALDYYPSISTGSSAAAAAAAAEDEVRPSICRDATYRHHPETLDTCTERFKLISFVSARSSTISRDSGFFSPDCSVTTSAGLSFDQCVPESVNDNNSIVEDEFHYGFDLQTYVDEDGDTHLHTAIVQKREDVVPELLQCTLPPGYVNFRDAQSRTALHLAVLSDQPEMLQGLMQVGANPFLRDPQGETALHIACANGFLTCVKTLVALMTFFFRRSDIDPDLKNYKGFSSLHLAAANGHYDVVSFLVRHLNADVNVGDGCSGRTILHHAADSGDTKMVKFLLSEFRHCVNVHAVAHDKRTTPLALALGRGYGDIAVLLEEAGARLSCTCEYDMVSDSDDDDLC